MESFGRLRAEYIRRIPQDTIRTFGRINFEAGRRSPNLPHQPRHPSRSLIGNTAFNPNY